MSESPSPQSQAKALVARFDAARDTFLAAFAEAPDEALSYTPAGEEYALGILPLHLQDSMTNYLDVYERVTAVDFGPVDLAADSTRATQRAERHRLLTVTKPTGKDRAASLADLTATHRRVTEQFGTLDDAALTRKADVIYSLGTDPYPTSAADILGWLADHYNEHIAQTTQLLARWQSEQAR
ncbi:MAG TPA: DinB family protein [Ktedonobacterales bacterium]|nr:DinB family protein [Ktedonobacterales bacterium]